MENIYIVVNNNKEFHEDGLFAIYNGQEIGFIDYDDNNVLLKTIHRDLVDNSFTLANDKTYSKVVSKTEISDIKEYVLYAEYKFNDYPASISYDHKLVTLFLSSELGKKQDIMFEPDDKLSVSLPIDEVKLKSLEDLNVIKGNKVLDSKVLKCLVGATMALLLVLLIYTIMNIDNKPVEKDPKQAVVTMKYDVNNPNKAIAKLYKELKEQEMDLKGLTIVEGSKEGTLDIVNSNNESCIKEDAIGIIIASRAYLVIDYGNNEPDLFNINTSSILPIKYNSFNHVRERVDSTDKKHYTKSYIKVELNDKKCYIYDDKGNVVSESKYCSDEQTYISRDKDNNITEERFEDLKDIVDWERTQ